ncbi:hypothetical protein F5J12DRAFT_846664 [Pisolithus orientalis]|uniref:uncharacterized protein n=1 Tax=Pisolithus orientalis TaxID=936130 RepID=UPI00222467C4|nr:uncharacterized protein F5J12DRAFT_846664 [Pisolithus orientalis]KAI5999788.1 hypothetical protein F5J12DRAFT_846664 [Pisolithus orientalis]
MSMKRKLEEDMTVLPEDVRVEKKQAICPNSLEDSGVNTAHMPTTALASLLDLSALTTREDISSRFGAIAHELLCNYVLTIVRNGVYSNCEILEVEFYLQKSGCHEDPFTHGSFEQEKSGQWYFHRTPCRADGTSSGLQVRAAGGYRGGTRKGLDLTLGPSSFNTERSRIVTIRGGALFRTLRRYPEQKIICGPSLLVDEVLRASGVSSISDLVTDVWNNDIKALGAPAHLRSTYMYLRPRGKSPVPPSKTLQIVYNSPRIGLDLSSPETKVSLEHPRVVFVGAPYRYFTHPELLSTKGRLQTFCGLYMALRESNQYSHDSAKLKQELCRLMGLKEASVAKLLSDFRAGYETGMLKSFVGVAGKGVCRSSAAYLKMIGTLQRAKEQASAS